MVRTQRSHCQGPGLMCSRDYKQRERTVSLALGKAGQFCFTRYRHLAKKTDVCQSHLATQHNPRARGNRAYPPRPVPKVSSITYERSSTPSPGQPPQHCSQCLFLEYPFRPQTEAVPFIDISSQGSLHLWMMVFM